MTWIDILVFANGFIIAQTAFKLRSTWETNACDYSLHDFSYTYDYLFMTTWAKLTE